MKRHEPLIIEAEKQQENEIPEPVDPLQLQKDFQLYEATLKKDVLLVRQLIAQQADVFFQNAEDHMKTPLHVAAHAGSIELVECLIDSGAPWNVLDAYGKTTGEYALEGGHPAIYEVLLNAGIRAELILNCASRKFSSGVPNEQFLTQKLQYNDAMQSLVDPEGHGIMMGWERPIMEKHAQIIARPGGDVLNVGFGMGLIDTLLQQSGPRTHTIVEAHPDVYAYMQREGWDKKPGVKVVFGRWQDVIDEFEQYDGIFFDTFGEFYQDLREFHEELPALLKPGGVYSFFNGLGATNAFFHDVYCKIVELEMRDWGFETQFVKEEIVVNEKVWEGINGKYFQLKYYNYPIIKWSNQEEVENNETEAVEVESDGVDADGDVHNNS